MARPSIVLKDAGLVTERRQGRCRFCSVNFEKLSEAVGFFDGFWKEESPNPKCRAE